MLDKTIDILEMVSLYSFLGALALGCFVMVRKALAKRREKEPAGRV